MSRIVSTTTTLSKVRGFTIDLLFLFQNYELRVKDLIDLTGKYRQYINRYLYNMRSYGLIVKIGPYWKLTAEGASFLSYLKSLPTTTTTSITEKKKDRRKKEERRKKEGRKKIPKKLKQTSFSLWLDNSGLSLDEAERNVVEVLMDHYNRTGSKFFFCDDLLAVVERFGILPDQVNRVLKNLKQDHVVYNYRDRNHASWKIGLYKAFVETLQRSQEG